MVEPKDDSGYNSNLAIHNDIFLFENIIDVNDEVSQISDLVSKSHINEVVEDSNKNQIQISSGIISSTPYGHLQIDEHQHFEDRTIDSDTPRNRKRKKPLTFQFSKVDHTLIVDANDELYNSPTESHQQLKTKCTRKLWIDISDGSLSDTDLSCEKSSKKIRLEGSRSEPNSPQRNGSGQSPIKNMKLGSAETNEVLYPNICYKPKPKKYKISTPSQIRQLIKEKLLFEKIADIRKPNKNLESFIRASSNVDFFTLFTVKSSNYHIIENILWYVDPIDLVSIYDVSKTARNCICKNSILNNLRKNHQRQKRINKENLCCISSPSHNNNDSLLRIQHEYTNVSACSLATLNTSDSQRQQSFSLGYNHNTSTNLSINKCLKINNTYGKISNGLITKGGARVSPRKREWLKFVEASADLTPGQKLTRCSRCSNPARVISNVVICTRRGCQFICCTKCCNPLCLSVLYFEKYSDTENIPTAPEFFNAIPICNNDDTTDPNNDMWLRKQRDHHRIFGNYLAECSNSSQRDASLSLSFVDLDNEIISNNNNQTNSLFCSSIFNLNISENDQKHFLPKTVNDLIECKTNKLKKSVVHQNLFFVPESPPKVNRSSTINSKLSKKNLRRL